MKSKTLIGKQLQRKNNPALVETIISAKKKDAWNEVAGILSGSRRNRVNLNLTEINANSGDSKIVVIPGKVLSQGEVSKKFKVVALNFSERAREKLLKSGCDVSSMLDEIKSNPEAKGVKVLR